jgi:hypothetical protein
VLVTRRCMLCCPTCCGWCSSRAGNGVVSEPAVVGTGLIADGIARLLGRYGVRRASAPPAHSVGAGPVILAADGWDADAWAGWAPTPPRPGRDGPHRGPAADGLRRARVGSGLGWRQAAAGESMSSWLPAAAVSALAVAGAAVWRLDRDRDAKRVLTVADKSLLVEPPGHGREVISDDRPLAIRSEDPRRPPRPAAPGGRTPERRQRRRPA